MDYILGGGIAGLIISLYYKTFSIIAKGKGQDREYLGLRVLKKTDAVEEFMNKFINKGTSKVIVPRVFKSGVWIGNEIRTDKLDKISDTEKLNSNDWSVVKGVHDIKGYDMVEVYKELVNQFDIKTRRMFINIKKISKSKKTISGTNPIHKRIEIALLYNRLISTLPVVSFNSLVEGEFIKTTNSQVYVCILESSELASKMSKIDFVYFPEEKIPYYRITKVGERRFCVESEKVFMPKIDFSFGCKILKVMQLSFGRILNKIKPVNVSNVVHLGRNAICDQSFGVDKLIKILEDKEVRI